MFVDNAGADVVLGMLPLARELLRGGSEVRQYLLLELQTRRIPWERELDNGVRLWPASCSAARQAMRFATMLEVVKLM